MKKISIIGMGWLGKQLGEYLDLKGYEVVGTYHSAEKKSEFNKLGWKVMQFSVEDAVFSTDFKSKILSAEIIILTIPPSTLKLTYAKAMEKLLFQIKNENPQAIVFYTSSTSVYGSYDKLIALNENSPLQPITTNAKEIVKVEQLIQKHFNSFCILRLGGLLGPNRQPIKYLAGRVGIEKPNAPINLVHSKDICEFVLLAIQNNSLPQVVNLVSPIHPKKIDYYTTVAKKMNLEIPQFNISDEREGKKIDSVFLEPMNFNFTYPSPFDYPNEIS